MSRIEQIIDDIETFINGCKMVPLSSSKIAVNKEEMKEYLADLREEIPVEIKQPHYNFLLNHCDFGQWCEWSISNPK